jgi:hypothetical protein
MSSGNSRPLSPTSERLGDYASEASLQAAVVELAGLLGWYVHHDRGDYRQTIAGDPGFPDLVLGPERRRLPERRPVFAELKTSKGALTESQALWLRAVRGYVWTPTDWTSSRIYDFLRARTEKIALDIASKAGWLRDPDDIRFGPAVETEEIYRSPSV